MKQPWALISKKKKFRFLRRLLTPIDAEDPPLNGSPTQGSMKFSGLTNSRLLFGNQAGWTFGIGDFTVECWFWKKPGSGSASRLWTVGDWPSAQIGVSLESSASYLWVNGALLAFSNPTNYAWHHIAVVRASGVFNLYLDGSRLINNSSYTGTSLTAAALGLGNEPNYSSIGTFKGVITNFRIVKGTAVYSGASFVVPTGPLAEITNTQLLLLGGTSNDPGDDTSVFNRNPTDTVGLSWLRSSPW